ncbi:MAG: ATP-binding cassette domain-containing protein [Alkalispirochaetaceae bacterium]
MSATVAQLLAAEPEAQELLKSWGLLSGERLSLTLSEAVASLGEEHSSAAGITPEGAEKAVEEYLAAKALLTEQEPPLSELLILPGRDKQGRSEEFDSIRLSPGEVVCIVGPTGSGKSRLLGDIEWLADGDSPTGRRVLLNGRGRKPGERRRQGLVAQLSQNMNFVIDLRVREFLELHAESRGVGNATQVVRETMEWANSLAGERFEETSPVTSLSGGQSRALMIADTALISSSPIVLIDEIENAGIDRSRALELLTGAEKIVLMATHDPLLALRAERRLVISGGGIRSVIHRTEGELDALERLTQIDGILQGCREAIRSGSVVLPEMIDQ